MISRTELFARLAVAFAVGIGVGGCGGKPMAPRPPAPPEPELTKVLRELSEVEEVESTPVVVAVARDPERLMLFDLEKQKVLWEQEAAIDTGPVLTFDLIVTREGEFIVGRDLLSGGVRFKIEEEGSLVGAASDGKIAVLSLDMGKESKPQGRLLGVIDGSVAWAREFYLRVGGPTLVDNIVVVPWASQRISMLDPLTGEERSRIQTEKMTSHVFVDSGHVFFGGLGITRLGAGSADSKAGALVTYEPKNRELPGQPSIMPRGYDKAPPPDDASHRVRLAWKIDNKESNLGFESGNIYFVFYRYLFAFDADVDTVKWVYIHPHDLVGVKAVKGGVLVADQNGELSFHNGKTGSITWNTSIGAPLMSAVLRPASPPEQKTKAGKRPPLEKQLLEAAELSDPRLVGARALAIRYYAEFDSEDVTFELIELCADRSNLPMVRNAACDKVAQRKKGAKHVRAALAKRASYLDEVSPPPVAALAGAAVQMNMRTAVADLLSHVKDPATPSEELAGAFDALGELGNASTGDSIEEYLQFYHAETSDPVFIAALGSAAEALVRLKDQKNATATLERLQKDPFTSPKLKQLLTGTLESLKPKEKPEPKPSEEPEEKKPEPVEDTRPERLTSDMLQKLFTPLLGDMKKCLDKDTKKIKLVVVVNPTGEIVTVGANPNEKKTCVEPLVRKIQFPATKKDKPEKLTYFIHE